MGTSSIYDSLAQVPMAYVPLIRLFLSSPGDVYEERAIVHEEIETLINRPTFREKIAFRVIAWDKKGAGTVMRFRMPPQEAINLGLPRPSECDIVVVLFWSRLGTRFTGYDGQTYHSGTHYELIDAIDSPRPEVVIYKRDETPYFDPDAPDFDQKTEQYKRLKDFLTTEVFYDPQTGSPRGVSHHASPEDFRIEFRTHLEQLALDFLAKADQASEATKTAVATANAALPQVPQVTAIDASEWHRSPFPGLRAFTHADAPIYFGRGREADLVIKQLANSRFVAVVGASGSGKSSLVAAGVVPRLQERNAIYSNQTASEYWRLVQLTPSSHKSTIYASPFEALYYALLEVFPNLVDNPLRAQRVKREFLEDILTDPHTLCEACKFLLVDAPTGSEVLLFIDQFEELFTLVPQGERKPFVEVLKAASETSFMRVILTMRSDFYQHCVDLPTLAHLLQQGSLPLSTPTGRALYEMIQFPADRAALQFEAGLVAVILKDTGESAGALALLAYALDELYQIAELRGDKQIRFEDYTALGGVHGAIGKRAEAVFQALAGDDAEKTATLKALFHALVSVSEEGTPTRQRMRYHAENTDHATRQLIEALTQARLLTKDSLDQQQETLEVAHEALFRSWERLKNWIAEAQEDLILLRQVRNAAHEWHAKERPSFLLWPQERLTLVYTMRESLKPELNDVEADFIEPEQARLLREIAQIETDHKRRRWIGERLATIGDRRSGVRVDDRGLPQIDWLPFPVGGDIEIQGHLFTVQPFFVAKHLVTYAQFQAFLDAPDGFWDDPWWAGMPDKYKKQDMSSAVAQYDNYPRDSVSWYQSVAFCRWLDAHYRQQNLFANFPVGTANGVSENSGHAVARLYETIRLNPNDWQIRLPTEWEWQWMAQGGIAALNYPWGDWDKHPRANTTEAGIGDHSTAVGMYPYGAAHCGALDVAGNLWEWCLNDYGSPEPINISSNEQKVLRGGSFLSDQALAAASFRYYGRSPSYNGSDYGLRLVVSVPVALLSRTASLISG